MDTEADRHPQWSSLLAEVEAAEAGKGVSGAVLARVLARVRTGSAQTGTGVARVDIASGKMMRRPDPLSAGSVTKAAEALIRARLLSPSGARQERRMGPIVPLQLSDERFVVGVHVGSENGRLGCLLGVLARLNGQVVAWSEPDIDTDRERRGTVEALVDEITALVMSLVDSDHARQAGLERADLLGVGVEIGAHVHDGEVIIDPNCRDLDQARLVPALADRLQCPTILENDVTARVIHAYYDNRLHSLDAVVVEVFDGGVGGAMVVNGRVYRGAGGLALEPGHLTVEYPKLPVITQSAGPAERQDQLGDRAFGDPCTCSTPARLRYGHVDGLATVDRIRGELKRRQLPDIEIAAATPGLIPATDDTIRLSDEGAVFRRAGTALGRGLAAIINLVNPGQLVLRLPWILATAASGTSGAQYLAAVENAVNDAFSTGPSDARDGNQRLPVEVVDDRDQKTVPREGALAAATIALNGFLEHARGRDGCQPKRSRRNRQTEAA